MALRFTGAGIAELVSLPSSLSLPAGSDVTVHFWNFLPAVPAAGGAGFIIGAGDPNRLMSHSPWSDGIFYWDYGDINAGNGARVSASYAPYYGRWVSVGLVAKSGFHAIYFSGQLVVSGTGLGVTTLGVSGGSIGGWSGSYYHQGGVDEFSVWNAVLSPGEIKALSQGIDPLFIRTANLLGSYPLMGDGRDRARKNNAAFASATRETSPAPLPGASRVILGSRL